MNREIVEYIVLYDVRVEDKVMEYIKNGRQPFGSPFMSGEIYTRQAMVKYAPLPDHIQQINARESKIYKDGKEYRVVRGTLETCMQCKQHYRIEEGHECPLPGTDKND